jgi:hypothetical protein
MYATKMKFLLAVLLVAFAANAFGQQRHINGTPQFVVRPGGNAAAAVNESTFATNIPLWSSSFVSGGITYNYTMVGANPTTSNATTKIPVVFIPLKFKFGTKIISPTAVACGDTTSALTRLKKSPLFNNFHFVEGTTSVGTTQYPDAFQRANFWQSVGSVTPNYHTLLSPSTTKPAQTIVVPTSAGGLVGAFCGTQQVGTADINFVDAKLQALLTTLAIPKTSIPIFVSYDVFETSGGGCCILGYHSSTASSQTYLIAAYSDPGIFSVPIEDIHAMSHEIGEWLDDPFGNNIVPTWGNVGQVSGCQNNLEVGDPVTGNAFTATLNGFTYHPEDLVFFSWFARQSPSIAVNGWYTFLNGLGGTFSKTCP